MPTTFRLPKKIERQVKLILSDKRFGLIHVGVEDIETSEKELFSKNYQSWLPKTKAIVVELHDWITPGCSKTFLRQSTNVLTIIRIVQEVKTLL